MRKVIYDYEAESLNLGLSRPWQVAWRIEENGKTIKRKVRWIDVPNLNVSPGAAAATRFSYEEWHRKKEPLKDVVDEIRHDFIEDKESTLVAHNGLGYDVYVMRNLFAEAGLDLNFRDIILRHRDTLSLARARYLELTPPEFGTVEFALFQYKMLRAHQKGMKTSLGALCMEFSIPYDPNMAHDALYDVDLLSEVDKKLIYALDIS